MHSTPAAKTAAAPRSTGRVRADDRHAQPVAAIDPDDLAGVPAPVQATPGTVFIDPTARPGGDGSAAHPFASWSQVPITPGTIYLQRAGTTDTAYVHVSAGARADRPTILGSYGVGTQPILNGCVNLDGASYVGVTGLSVRNTAGAAIAIQHGAHDITVSGNTLGQSMMGVWIGNGAGSSNVIGNNVISGNTLDGIAIDKVANPGQGATFITGNTVTGNGVHGIELDANHVVVTGNTVGGNGVLQPGASGIHVFSGAGNDGFGNGNVITGNVAVGTHDTTGPDGNGIELDQFTSGNVVYGNLAYGNDGAGIMLYDSSSNIVAGNVVGDNARDPGHSHGIRGGVVLLSGSTTVSGNLVLGNTGFGGTDAPGVFVDAISAAAGNAFAGNVWENALGAAAQLGDRQSWADWQGFAPQDRGSLVSLSQATGPMAYSFPAGTMQTIDGVPRLLLGWSAGHLVVG